ncbi:PCRF domain-containing protein [Chloroflexota bacterium]
MWDKLEQIDKRYQELEEQIATPEIASDPKQLQKLAQERASIESVVTKYREYKATSKALEETRAMLNDGLDEDMTALVKQEIESLEAKLDHQLQELKLALLPKDDSDKRDIIVEIRAGAGGDEAGLYVAAHKDLFTSDIVGYAMGERLTRNLVSQSLFKAIEAKRPDKGLIHHSDRGNQYCSHEYRNILESFWGTLKQELVHHRRYRTRQEAIQDITEYIEIFYKRQRLQPGLGFLSPAVFEQRYYAGLVAA